VKVETVSGTELEGPRAVLKEVQRREAVLAFSGGHTKEGFFFCRMQGDRESKRHVVRKAREESVTLGQVRENRDRNQAVSKGGEKGSSFITLTAKDWSTARNQM